MKQLSAAGALGVFVVCVATGQTNPVNTTAVQPVRDGTVVVPDRPTTTDAANVTTANSRPPRAERKDLPPEVLARIERFKLDARAYLARQEALKKQLQGANDNDRAAIRQQLKELRAQWTERAKEMRKEYKERQAELADKLDDYRALLNEVRATTLKDAGGRTRRGDD